MLIYVDWLKNNVQLIKNYKLYPCSSNYPFFSNLRAKCKYFSKSCYTNYLRKIQNNLKSNSKDFWRFVKYIHEDNLIPSSMIFNDLTHENYSSISNDFAKYFSSVYFAPQQPVISQPFTLSQIRLTSTRIIFFFLKYFKV